MLSRLRAHGSVMHMASDTVSSPGYRRRIRIVPEQGRCTAALEDDYHRMTVTLSHDAGHVVQVEAKLERAPWTTCPGATLQLARDLTGAALAEVSRIASKRANCTHLHDLATLAAAHWRDAAPSVIDIWVADPRDGVRDAELRHNGEPEMAWRLDGSMLVAPEGAAGLPLTGLRDWIASLDAAKREHARLLQWACMVAHGRLIPLSEQSDAKRFPASCYTFQPERAQAAVRIGEIVDFSSTLRQPLD